MVAVKDATRTVPFHSHRASTYGLESLTADGESRSCATSDDRDEDGPELQDGPDESGAGARAGSATDASVRQNRTVAVLLSFVAGSVRAYGSGSTRYGLEWSRQRKRIYCPRGTTMPRNDGALDELALAHRRDPDRRSGQHRGGRCTGSVGGVADGCVAGRYSFGECQTIERY